jgi:hypothetical protein
MSKHEDEMEERVKGSAKEIETERGSKWNN